MIPKSERSGRGIAVTKLIGFGSFILIYLAAWLLADRPQPAPYQARSAACGLLQAGARPLDGPERLRERLGSAAHMGGIGVNLRQHVAGDEGAQYEVG